MNTENPIHIFNKRTETGPGQWFPVTDGYMRLTGIMTQGTSAAVKIEIADDQGGAVTDLGVSWALDTVNQRLASGWVGIAARWIRANMTAANGAVVTITLGS